MIEQTYADIYTPELATGAIINDEFEGFAKDYMMLHCLLRKYKPNSYFELGTNLGVGLNIACNAIYSYNPDANIYSLDLPTELAHISLQHPISEGKGDRVGEKCLRNFEQLRGDSMEFDFKNYPCEGAFVDGEHLYDNAYHETMEIMHHRPKIIIWHDADMPEVWGAIKDSVNDFGLAHSGIEPDNELYRITDTRIAYCLKKELPEWAKK